MFTGVDGDLVTAFVQYIQVTLGVIIYYSYYYYSF